MSKKEVGTNKVKITKTVKLQTVVISIAVFIAIVASFIGGFCFSNEVNNYIDRAVTTKYEQLKSES